jgi:hypothetical protein
MNNILYIGPYRQRDIDGLWSTALAQNILSNQTNNLALRPIFLDSKFAIKDIEASLCNKENTRLPKIDTVIQHVPLEKANTIDSIDRNILIPIVNTNLVPKDNIDKISKFDGILVDNKSDSIRISQAYPSLQKLVKHIDYVFDIDPSHKLSFNIGLLNNSEKLYMVCSCKNNTRVIYDIIISFIGNIKSKDTVLVLFTLDISPAEKAELDRFIKEAYSSMDLGHSINRVIVAPITSDLNNIYAAHKSGDIFIDAIDYGSNSINLKIANSLKKSVIKIDPDYIFSLTDGNNKINQVGSLKISSQTINTSIKKYLDSSQIYNTTSLFKTHHINKYL